MKSILTTIAALLTASIAADATANGTVGIEYSIGNDGAVVVGCDNTNIVDIPETVLYEGEEYPVIGIAGRAFFNCNKMTSISLPSSLTYIGEKAFYGCNSLLSLELPSSVTTIGQNAFEKCLSIEALSLSSSLTEIADETFKDCYAISSVTIPSSVTRIGNSAFYSCYSMTSISIPTSVTEIGGWAFYGCDHLKTVTIPSSITEIKESAFWNCTSLESVTISSSVKDIKRGTFYGCHSLTSVVIPSSVVNIGEKAFEQCLVLPYVIIPSSVTNIGEDAFWNCESLKTIVSLPTVPPVIERNVFYRVPEDAIIYIPAGTLEQYPVAEGWTAFHDFRELGSLTLKISDSQLNLSPNESSTLTVYVDKAPDMTIVSEAWTTSNPEVAIVDNGMVTAVGNGTATISFILIDGTGCPHVATCDVFVEGYSKVVNAAVDNHDAQVEYYDLNGMRINSETLTPGIYIKKQGLRTTKILVKQ